MSVGKKIKLYLEETGISQTFISNKTKIPLPKLNLALNGKRNFTFEEYEKICGVLQVGVDKFLSPKKLSEKAG